MRESTLIFLLLLSAALALQIWLALRQLRHVRAHREQVPPAFAADIPLAAHWRAADYTLERTRFGLLALAVDTLVLLGWTLGGGFAALDAAWRGFGWGETATGVAVIGSAIAIGSLLVLPLKLWRVFVIEARHGFNRTTPALFASDLVKGTLLGAALGLPLLALALWLMAHGGQWWWVWVWAAWSGFQLLMLWVYPVFIAPLFNRFEPLADQSLRARVEALLARCGYASGGLYVMDGSRRSGHGNAYFTGFGRARRIVFFDTLLATLDPDEIEAVLAHELGHFKRRHIVSRIALSLGLALAGLGVCAWLIGQPGFFLALGVPQPSTWAGLYLFLSVAGSLGILLQPPLAWYSRRHEFEADAYAAEVADGGALKRALVRLYRDNAATLTPDPLHSAVYDSHPPAPQRIAALERHTTPHAGAPA